MTNYKVIHEDENMFHVEHPDGSRFKVHKKGLSKTVLDKISKMKVQNFDQGGVVGSGVLDDTAGNPTPPPSDDNNNLFSQFVSPNNVPQGPKDAAEAQLNHFEELKSNWLRNYQAMGNPGEPKVFQNLPETKAENRALDQLQSEKAESERQSLAKTAQMKLHDQALEDLNKKRLSLGLPTIQPPEVKLASDLQPNLAQQPPQGAPPQQPDQKSGAFDPAFGNMNTLGAADKYMTNGIYGLAAAQKEQAEKNAKAWADYQTASANQAKATQALIDTNETERSKLQQGIMKAKIDPHRLWNDKLIGSKVLSAIGIALSGIGSGMSGGPNLAINMLNKQVDDDINAQKIDLGKKENLLNYNFKKFGDIHTADTATRLQLNTVLQSQIAMAAAQAGSKEAMARAQLLIGEMKKSEAPMQTKLAQMQLQALSKRAGGIPEHSQLDQMMQWYDPKYNDTRVPIDGNVYHANNKEAAEKVKGVELLTRPILEGVKRLDQLGPSALFENSPSYGEAQSIIGDLSVKLPLLSGALIGAKRMNAEEMHAQVQRLKDPTSLKQMLNGGLKNQTLFKALEKEREDVRRQYVPNYLGVSTIQGRSEGFK